MREMIKDYVGDGRRYEHTLSVESECAVLADRYGLSCEDKLRLAYAALLHDITKKLTPDEQKELYRHFGLDFDDAAAHSYKTLHAVTGSALAREKFPEVADEAVCSAVRWHTTARPRMTMLEKLLYLADYIEPTRTFDDCVKLRKLYYDSTENDRSAEALDRIIYISLKMTVENLLSEDKYIHRDTIEALNYYLPENGGR